MRNKLLWLSFYAATIIAFLGIAAVDSTSLLPAFAALGALIYISLFIIANSDDFERADE